MLGYFHRDRQVACPDSKPPYQSKIAGFRNFLFDSTLYGFQLGSLHWLFTQHLAGPSTFANCLLLIANWYQTLDFSFLKKTGLTT
jgi:hypothetical protein